MELQGEAFTLCHGAHVTANWDEYHVDWEGWSRKYWCCASEKRRKGIWTKSEDSFSQKPFINYLKTSETFSFFAGCAIPEFLKDFHLCSNTLHLVEFLIFDLRTARQVCQLQNVTAMRTMFAISLFAFQKHIWPADTKNFNKSYGIQKAKIATIWWTISIYFIDFQSP